MPQFAGPIISDKLLAGLSFGGKTFDGTYKNVGFPSDNLQGYNNQTASIDLLIRPVDRLQIDVFASYSDFYNEARAQRILPNNCGRSAAGAVVQLCGAVPFSKDADISPGAIGNVGDILDASVTVNFDITDRLTFTSQTAYTDVNLENNFDDLDLSTAGAPYRITDSVTGASRTVNTQFWIAQSNGRTESQSQEFRLTYKSDRINGILGAYYFDTDKDNKTAVSIDRTGFGPNERGIFPQFETAQVFSNPGLGTQALNERTQTAYFGQLGIELFAGLRATAETRYTRDEVEQKLHSGEGRIAAAEKLQILDAAVHGRLHAG